MSKTIAEITGVGAPNPVEIRKLLAQPQVSPDPTLMFGMELEIEGVRDPNGLLVDHVRWVEDGSLRNGGFEYLTTPMRHRELMYVLNNFYQRAQLTEANFSDRCSIHVHVNCLDMTVEQLSAVLMQYQVFEKLLYQFIGHEREGNIFCVPWHATTLTYQVVDRLFKEGLKPVKQWQKYTGLNLLPLLELGTIEFRQMHGHNDIKKIEQWLLLIASMFAYARRHNTDSIKERLLALNTSSQYHNIVEDVFGQHAGILLTGDYKAALEDGVVTMKYSLVKIPEKTYFSATALTLDNWLDDEPPEPELLEDTADPEEPPEDVEPVDPVQQVNWQAIHQEHRRIIDQNRVFLNANANTIVWPARNVAIAAEMAQQRGQAQVQPDNLTLGEIRIREAQMRLREEDQRRRLAAAEAIRVRNDAR